MMRAPSRTRSDRAGEPTPERSWERVYRVVRRIPAGRVATYGQVAAHAGMPRAARQVGYALHALGPGSAVPWHRVVNAKGCISGREPRESVPLQRARLEAEGIAFGRGDTIDLDRFGWRPRGSAPTPERGGRKSRGSHS
ncbi:MAG: methylated-DNA--[protein]-cysteine S-methyltransferase [Myxococcota bacterium]